jgi:hypothetical protein
MAFNEATISSNGIVRPTYIEVNLTRQIENYRVKSGQIFRKSAH